MKGGEIPWIHQLGIIVLARGRFKGMTHGPSYQILRGGGSAGVSRRIANLEEVKKPAALSAELGISAEYIEGRGGVRSINGRIGMLLRRNRYDVFGFPRTQRQTQ